MLRCVALWLTLCQGAAKALELDWWQSQLLSHRVQLDAQKGDGRWKDDTCHVLLVARGACKSLWSFARLWHNTGSLEDPTRGSHPNSAQCLSLLYNWVPRPARLWLLKTALGLSTGRRAKPCHNTTVHSILCPVDVDCLGALVRACMHYANLSWPSAHPDHMRPPGMLLGQQTHTPTSRGMEKFHHWCWILEVWRNPQRGKTFLAGAVWVSAHTWGSGCYQPASGHFIHNVVIVCGKVVKYGMKIAWWRPQRGPGFKAHIEAWCYIPAQEGCKNLILVWWKDWHLLWKREEIHDRLLNGSVAREDLEWLRHTLQS